jgi:hypothetical protein
MSNAVIRRLSGSFRGGAWVFAALAALSSSACGGKQSGPSPGGEPDARSDSAAQATDIAPSSNDNCPPVTAYDAPICCGVEDYHLQPVAPDTPCVFAIPIPPPDPTNVAVYVDRAMVAESQTDGWTFGPTTATLVLTGTYCDAITSGTSGGRVDLLCGCPGPPPVCIP